MLVIVVVAIIVIATETPGGLAEIFGGKSGNNRMRICKSG